MRTTLDLPQELFRQVKARAALAGLTLKDLLTQYVRDGLNQPGINGPRAQGRSTLPVVPRRGKSTVPNLTPELQDRLQEEEDLGKLRRSFGH